MGGELDATFFLQVAGFCVCVVASASFSGSETALTSMTRLRVRQLLGGARTHHALERWLDQPNQFLATVLVGNTIINVVASLLGGSICATLVRHTWPAAPGWVSAIVALIGISSVLLVFGEIMPKTYAKVRAERWSQRVAGPVHALCRMMAPLVRLLLWISRRTLAWFAGDTHQEEGPFFTEDTIRTLVEVGEQEGVLQRNEREMIHSIIEFGDTVAREVMTPRTDIIFLSQDVTLEEILKIAVEHGHSRMPVTGKSHDDVLGMLHTRDLLKVLPGSGGPRSFDIRHFLRPVKFVPETKPIDDLLKEMQASKQHMAIVVDEYGGTSGLVTIEDVLEEIVGEIQDEYDQEEEPCRRNADGTFEAQAKIDLHDLEHVIGVALPADEYDSLGGFLTATHGDVPRPAEVIAYQDLRFTVLDADERKVRRVKIERLNAAPGVDAPASAQQPSRKP